MCTKSVRSFAISPSSFFSEMILYNSVRVFDRDKCERRHAMKYQYKYVMSITRVRVKVTNSLCLKLCDNPSCSKLIDKCNKLSILSQRGCNLVAMVRSFV